MKILENPWVVSLLGLVAVGAVVSQTFHFGGPHIPPPATGGAPPPGAGAAPSAPAAPVVTDVPLTPLPALAMDSNYIKSHFAGWINTPQRDPFLQRHPVSPISTNLLMRQLSLLKLKAIWRQGGVSMVAINDGIYRVNDRIAGCKVERIDPNGVWLDLAGQKDFIVFDGEANPNEPTNEPPNGPTNEPPATVSPPKSLLDNLYK